VHLVGFLLKIRWCKPKFLQYASSASARILPVTVVQLIVLLEDSFDHVHSECFRIRVVQYCQYTV